MYYIYGHHCKITDKWYIGQTVNIKRRYGENGCNYLQKDKRNHNKYKHSKFAPAILKYGWDNFEHIILETCSTREDANSLEVSYIKKYNSFENGYNSTPGGDIQLDIHGKNNPTARKVLCVELNKTFDTCTEAAKYFKNPNLKKDGHISAACSGKRKTAAGYHWRYADDKGILPRNPISEKQKKKLSDKAKSQSAIFKVQVRCIETDDVFDSVIDAAKAVGLTNGSSISACLAGRKKTAKGYHWEYADPEKHGRNLSKKIAEGDKQNKKAVICINTGIEYESITLAAKAYNISDTGIGGCCSGKFKSFGKLPDGTKLKWKYKNEN